MSGPSFCYYVSDWGMGHAARSIAIIRRMLAEWPGARIYVKAAGPSEFLCRSLPQCIHIWTENDAGVVMHPDRPAVDSRKTEERVKAWLATWDLYIRRETRFCREHDIGCIVSDIVPQPFLVADALSIPGIAVSNFSWHHVYSLLFGETPETGRLREAYGCCDLALVLPFHEPMEQFPARKKIGLVSREITVGRDRLRQRLAVRPEDRLIYLNAGADMPRILLETLEHLKDTRVKILVSSHVDAKQEHVVRIPGWDVETQNYLAACDLVVSKCGYSTISEAARAQVPLFVFRREGFAEDAYLVDGITDYRLGKEIAWETFRDGEFLESFPGDMMDNSAHMQGRSIPLNGCDDVLSAFSKVLR